MITKGRAKGACPPKFSPEKLGGFSLLEIIIASAIFVILSGSIFLTYGNIIESLGKSRDKALAVDLLNREMENIRNLSYDEIGIVGGFPPGLIPAQISKVFQGLSFEIHATVRNIDDDFDGTVSSTPKDTAPADYRLVELRAECPDCLNFKPLTLTTFVAPKGLEATSNNGSLFINVFDASGNPVSQADVSVTNNSL